MNDDDIKHAYEDNWTVIGSLFDYRNINFFLTATVIIEHDIDASSTA